MMVVSEYHCTELETKGVVALDTLTQLLDESLSVIGMDQQRRVLQVSAITRSR